MKKLLLLVVLIVLRLSSGLAAVYYVATNGSDTNAGDADHPFATIQRAQQAVAAGDTVYIRGGTYIMTESQIALKQSIWAYVTYLDKSGTSGKRINYWAYPGEQPVFDLSNIKPANYRITAFQVMGSWIHIKGLEVTGVQVTILTHTQSECFENQGSNNIYEQLVMHDGMAIGFYLTKGSNNLVLNCDAYRNWDNVSETKLGGNVDGFGCHPSKGGTGNVFSGCRAWFNSDDGYDLINAKEPVTFDNCWSFYNGYSSSFASLGDGNGFKAGGYGQAPVVSSLPNPIPSHTIRFCMAYRNKANGFYANHHVTAGSNWYNNTAYRNSTNFNMLSQRVTKSAKTGADTTLDCPGFNHILHNNVSFKYSTLRDTLNIGPTCDITNNSFTPLSGIVVNTSDFVSTDESLLIMPRLADGSLPAYGFLKLNTGSDLIDKGMDLGFPFRGSLPDLGAFEAKNWQVISFSSTGAKAYGDTPFQLTASSTSGLTVTFTTSNPFIASVSGNTVTIKRPGTVSIIASQTGNIDYYPALDASQELTIAQASQTITFDSISPKKYGDAALSLNAVSSSGLPVTFSSSDTTVAKVDGKVVTIVGIGTATITASQAGNDLYAAANPVQRVLTVTQATQVSQLSGNIVLSPNPTDGHFVLHVTGEQTGNLEITDLNGKIILSKTITTGNPYIDISSSPNGVYMVKWKGKNGVCIRKVIKK